MTGWKHRAAICGLTLALLPLPTLACGIVYGADWAFVSQTPDGWSEACGKEAMDKTAITLWPASQASDRSDALMYVTVSGKGEQSLDAFADEEIARFRASSKRSMVSAVRIAPALGSARRLVHITNAPGGHDELVAYIEGPTSFFIVVLSADSLALQQKYRAAFDEYLANFIPMERRSDSSADAARKS